MDHQIAIVSSPLLSPTLWSHVTEVKNGIILNLSGFIKPIGRDDYLISIRQKKRYLHLLYTCMAVRHCEDM